MSNLAYTITFSPVFWWLITALFIWGAIYFHKKAGIRPVDNDTEGDVWQ